jgi:biopolymer transport protein ExbD
MTLKTGSGFMAEINVTNLVDVVLVLLIIFMITAPMLHSGIEVNLPKTKATTRELGEGIVVTINQDGNIFLDDRPVTLKRFDSRLTTLRRQKGSETVYLKADREVQYGIVVDVVGRIKNLGITDLGLVSEPAR